jgi:hypothetical protein
MRTRLWTWLAIAVLPAAFSDHAIAQSAPSETPPAASEVYIQQSRGHVGAGPKTQSKLTPELTGVVGVPAATTGPTAPVTCNAQNASSQACYTATQQARPGR